eukprot:3693479-Ditylum_brightwellii.AAC.1
MLLANRISLAIAITNMGNEQFWVAVYIRLNMTIPPRTREYLCMKDKTMREKRDKAKKPENKIKRGVAKILKIAEETAKTKKDAKRQLTYLAGGCVTGDEVLQKQNRKKQKKHCTLPNCTNTKEHKTHKAKCCHWNAMFGHLPTKEALVQ